MREKFPRTNKRSAMPCELRCYFSHSCFCFSSYYHMITLTVDAFGKQMK